MYVYNSLSLNDLFDKRLPFVDKLRISEPVGKHCSNFLRFQILRPKQQRQQQLNRRSRTLSCATFVCSSALLRVQHTKEVIENVKTRLALSAPKKPAAGTR